MLCGLIIETMASHGAEPCARIHDRRIASEAAVAAGRTPVLETEGLERFPLVSEVPLAEVARLVPRLPKYGSDVGRLRRKWLSQRTLIDIRHHASLVRIAPG